MKNTIFANEIGNYLISMVRIKNIICLLILAMVTIGMKAQLENVVVASLKSTANLPVNEVNQIFEDSEGYMWYGTPDGLCRDDGYSVRVFRNSFNSPFVPNINNVLTIQETKGQDGTCFLWIGTSEGLYRMNKHTYAIELTEIEDLATASIDYMIATSDGTLWAVGGNSLFNLDGQGTLIKEYPLGFMVSCLYEDTKHQLWVSSFEGGLFLKDSNKHKSSKHSEVEGFIKIDSKLSLSAMIEDTGHKCYWLCERNDGLMKATLNGTNIKVEKQDMVKDDDGLSITYFTSLTEDDTYHYLWIISYYRGLYVFKVENGKLVKLSTDEILPPSHKILNTITKTKDGRLWVSGFDTNSFVISFKTSGLRHFTVDELNQRTHFAPTITSLCRDDEGMFWLSQKRSDLYLYDASAHKAVSYITQPGLRDAMLFLVTQIEKSAKPRSVWVVIDDDYIRQLSREGMTMQAGERINVDRAPGNTKPIKDIFEDSKGNLWVGTNEGVFIKHKNQKENKLVCISDTIGEIVDFAETPDGTIWGACRHKGMLRIQANGKFELFPLNRDFISIDATSDGKLWFGTRDGQVMLFDPSRPEGEQYTDYSEDCGMNGDMIGCIIVDKFDHVWIETNQNIMEFNPKNDAFRMFSTSTTNVHIQRLMPSSTFKDPDGTLYFGGIPGFIAFNPSDALDSTPRSMKVIVTDITLMGKSIWFDSAEGKKEGKITISHDSHNLSIHFSSLDFVNTANIRYAYQLKGIDDDWTILPVGQNSVLYNQLPKGEYHFLIKATDKNGLWSEEVTEIVIERLPAWYESVWAYILYALLLIGLVLFFVYQYKRYLQIQSQKQLTEDLTQTKLVYFTSISHELLTPLTIISCLTEQIDTENADTEHKLSLVKANVFRLRRLLQQVLDFRKVESRNMRLFVEKGNVTDFLKAICKESFEPLAKNKNLQFLTLLPVTDIEGYFDRDKFEKILFNLVSNAFKYTPEGKQVTLSAIVQPDNILRLSVKDEGIGIDAKEQKLIFNRFYTSKKTGGSISNGIGLALTKELVELHHGQIWVESQPKHGSEFIIELPIGKESFLAEEIKEEIQEAQIEMIKESEQNGESVIVGASTNEETASQMGLLMVEDNLELLSVMQGLLSKHYNVFAATNGEEALDIISREEIQIVVSDISMPKMDGLELCHRLKQNINTSHLIVILLTAKISAEAQVDSYNAGADGYLAKPFETKVLIGLLDNLKAQREKHQQQFRQNVREITADDLEVSDLDQQFLKKAIRIVERNLNSPNLDVQFLAEEMNMSRSTLSRKLKAITGQTAFDFIKSIRLKHAYMLLQNKTASVAEVMERVGYNDHHSFVQAFREMFGVLPSSL